MNNLKLGTIETTPANKKWYNRKGYTMTGETITETITDLDGQKTETTYIIFSGTWTRSGTVRDCGDHLIIARHSRYDRINKIDLSIIKDVEDE